MAPFQFDFNIDSELDRVIPGVVPVVPISVQRELLHLSDKGNRMARAALKLSIRYEQVGSTGRGDRAIFDLAVRNQWMVMTQDKALRSALLRAGITVVMVREKGHLELVEP